MSNFPKNLFIASEVRSGSTVIAESLAYSLYESYGVECWQIAHEHFSIMQYNRKNSNAQDIVSSLFINQFGFRCGKWMVNDLKYLFQSIRNGNRYDEQLIAEHTAWIIVLRKDIVRQSISSAYAKLSGVYHHYGSPEDCADADLELVYENVRLGFREILTSNYYLNAFSRKIQRGCVTYYEDYIVNPKQELIRVLDELKMPLDLSILRMVDPKLRQTAQEVKSAWRERFDDLFLSFP